MRDKMPTAVQMLSWYTINVCVTWKGTLLKNVPKDSDKIEARAAIAIKIRRVRTAYHRPEKAFVGGARRMDRPAGCGLRARSWYGARIATP
jgi:hypothetical protein